jgi:hypothetical protein
MLSTDSPPPSINVMNMWSYTFTPPYTLMTWYLSLDTTDMLTSLLQTVSVLLHAYICINVFKATFLHYFYQLGSGEWKWQQKEEMLLFLKRNY